MPSFHRPSTRCASLLSLCPHALPSRDCLILLSPVRHAEASVPRRHGSLRSLSLSPADGCRRARVVLFFVVVRDKFAERVSSPSLMCAGKDGAIKERASASCVLERAVPALVFPFRDNESRGTHVSLLIFFYRSRRSERVVFLWKLSTLAISKTAFSSPRERANERAQASGRLFSTNETQCEREVAREGESSTLICVAFGRGILGERESLVSRSSSVACKRGAAWTVSS